jgi:hypothetical protein
MIDIYRLIFNNSDLRTQIYLVSTNKYLRKNLKIVNLYDVDMEFRDLLTEKILKNKIFKNVTSFDANNLQLIKNVSFMKSLKKLNSWNGSINQKGIKDLDLEELNIAFNEKIYDVSFMTSLKKLNISYRRKKINISNLKSLKILIADESSIKQKDIEELKLEELHFNYNLKINNLLFMKKTLKKLKVTHHKNIGQNEIKNLKLIELDATNNHKITDVSFMKSLKILRAINLCGIDQNGIFGLMLNELYVCDNRKIIDVSFMSSLKILHASSNSGIDQNGIQNLKLIELDVSYNKKIKDITHITSLKKLNISYTEVNQRSRNFLNLIELNACGINQKDIEELKLLFLTSEYNKIENDIFDYSSST